MSCNIPIDSSPLAGSEESIDIRPDIRSSPDIAHEPQEARDDPRPHKEHSNYMESTCRDENEVDSGPAKELPTPESLFVSEDDSDEKAKLEFEKARDWFLSLPSPSWADFAQYETAKRAEETRKTRITHEKLPDETKAEPLEEVQTDAQVINILRGAGPHGPSPETAEAGEPESEIVTSTEEEELIVFPIAKGKRKAELSIYDSSRRRQVGLEKMVTDNNPQGRKKSHSKSIFTDAELDELFPNDYVQTVQANQLTDPAPTSKKRDKNKAMTELVSQVPVSDRGTARSDRDRLIEASKKYWGKAKHTEDGWIVKGLDSLLLPYQLEAGGWMIDREQSKAKPHGGLLCHEMGLGKTITTLSIVINQRCEKDPGAPTLIVVPSTLVTHWLEEIYKHCSADAKLRVGSHSAISRLRTPDLKEALKQHDILITTYYEICDSYPSKKPPKELVTEDQIKEWMHDNFDDNYGAFHKIKWYRIILDEAHLIRNKDTQTSIAIRALTGKYKWAITGTPLLNRTEELYPYLDFIEVPGISTYKDFNLEFCNGSTRNKDKLKNIVRTFMHRRTHKSRLFSAPLVDLPNIAGTNLIVEFCSVEKYLHQEIKKWFIQKVNDLASERSKQTTCILTLILRFRMFASHIITGQSIVKDVLDDRLMSNMKTLANEEAGQDGPSKTIVQILLCVTDGNGMYPAPAPLCTESECQRPRPTEDASLIGKFVEYMKTLHEQELWGERLERFNCASCNRIPSKSFITSCLHRYCEECFESLPDENETTDTAKRQCCSCGINIRSIILCTDVLESESSSAESPSNKKRNIGPTKQSGNQRKTKTRSQQKRPAHQTFSQWARTAESSFQSGGPQSLPCEVGVEPEPRPEDEPASDWVTQIGGSMPGAKFTAVENQLKIWLAEDKEAKIVVFTEFVDSNRLLQYMCRANQWNFSVMNGKISIKSREVQMEKFRNDKDTKILIASMKTGGFGLDLTMANKCVIYDLWWNNATEQQAYCRLHRIGQERDVEFIRVIAKDSIDEWIFKLQQKKLKEINQYISQKNLMSRNTLKELLSMFGDVHEDSGFGFFIAPNERQS